ncbi:ABC transporter substrate-binding protein [Sporosarcina sp. E16_3]|uniref:ABC transporter substrate-binding protein n=1 Tax=Sporosarcina sp. E16_3 TaxID=2789293 RepID=UPI001A936BDB|nr:ABC transporter substrate-binding protein [Sporosarcina sp. E16_3]MBO0600709.1 ABC transporter substrate-binding protein [Sporosarcina sp. E16_3]
MNRYMKLLSIQLVMGLFIIMGIAGCNTNTDKDDVVMEDLPELGDFSKELTLKLSGSFTQGKIEEDNWVQKKLEKMFNVKIVNTKNNTWSKDEVSLMVASGDVPDTFSFTAGTQTSRQLYEGGVTRTIPRAMIEKYAPLYSKMIDENAPGWEMNLAPEKENEYLNLTGYQGHAAGILWAPTFRLDWLENLGIAPPGEINPVGTEGGLERIFFTDKAYTLEEVEKILHAFTYDDPDGNGINDTYGMLPYNNQLHWMNTLMGAHGVASGYNLMEDGELISAEISNKYKEGLKLLAKWQEMGVIDPEWTTIDVETSWEKYKQGRTGYFTAQRSYVAMEEWTKTRAPQNLVAADPNVKVLVTAPEIGPDGQQGQGAWMPVTLLGDAFQISKDVTDEELARILQIFDYINHDDDSRWTIYGEVGEHSEWGGTPEESSLLVKEEYPSTEGNMGFNAYNFRTYSGKRLQWLTSEKTLKLMEQFFAKPEVVEKMAIRPYRYDLFNETKGQELTKRYSGQLNTIVEEFRMKAIVGELDVDKEWDSYVENWLKNGGKQVLEELEKAPKVSDLLEK